jgi:hypothetical protein
LQASLKWSKSTDNSSNTQQNIVQLGKGFSSTPDLKMSDMNGVPLVSVEDLMKKHAKTDLDLNQPTHHFNQDNGKVGDQRGYFTLPGRRGLKKFEDGNGSYRSIGKIRPLTATTARSLPPPDHAPPPPPVTSEVVILDKKAILSPDKSLSPVMSSFKPPEYSQPLTSEVISFPPPAAASAASASAFKQQRRANSMPPRPSRPQVLKRISTTSTTSEAAASGGAAETYNINGINYTTYTTFMSPLSPTGDDDVVVVPPGASLPLIPEPDYNNEAETYSSYNGLTKTVLERKKRKKSVSFVEDITSRKGSVESNVVKKSSMTSLLQHQMAPESILKDSSPPAVMTAHDRSRPAPALVGDKYMKPMERIPRLNPAALSRTVVTVTPDEKIRIHVLNSNSANHEDNDQIDNADNSSSGVSSDQESAAHKMTKTTTTTKFVTYLPVETESSSSPVVTTSAIQISKCNPNPNPNPNPNANVVNMKKMLHPKLAAIFDLPAPGSSAASRSQTLPHRSKEFKKNLKKVDSGHDQQQQQRSISESLALINQHVNSLGEVNSQVLAPPPGFSDPESSSGKCFFKSNCPRYHTFQTLSSAVYKTS